MLFKSIREKLIITVLPQATLCFCSQDKRQAEAV